MYTKKYELVSFDLEKLDLNTKCLQQSTPTLYMKIIPHLISINTTTTGMTHDHHPKAKPDFLALSPYTLLLLPSFS